ncbi:MAG: putative Ig domain-containing protein [Thermomicrobiales bacterium]
MRAPRHFLVRHRDRRHTESDGSTRESRRRLIGRGIVIGLCAVACVVALSLHAERVAAAGYTVNALTDTGTGSGTTGDLRYAINQVNAGAGTGDTITITATGTIPLGSALPALAKPVAITGPGAATLTVDGNHMVQVFLVNSGVTASITNLTIANGNAAGGGGGIQNNGTLTVTNSTLSGNSTSTYGGGIENTGTLTVTNSTLSGNSASGNNTSGGGIDNVGTLTMTNSTLSGNSAPYGGGIFSNIGTVTVTNSTLSGNSASFDGATGGFGGGIENGNGTLTVTNSTLSGNSASFDGGGSETFGTSNLTNTIVAGNTASQSGPDINGTVVSHGHNLIGTTSGTTGITNGTNGDIVNPMPRLDTLKDNGGTTPLPDGSHVKTFALLAGSPAIGAGDSAVCNSTTTPPGAAVGGKDQRGRPRPATACSIGAFEPQSLTLAPATLPNGTLTIPYSQTITASGGTVPYSFAITSGALPPGLTLATSGALSGTPTSAGSFAFTITATDHLGATGIRAYTLVVPPPNPLPPPQPGPAPFGQPAPAPRPQPAVPASGAPNPLPARRP